MSLISSLKQILAPAAETPVQVEREEPSFFVPRDLHPRRAHPPLPETAREANHEIVSGAWSKPEIWPETEYGTMRMEFMLTLRRYGISSQPVLRALDDVPRDQFVAPASRALAYADQALPIGCGQTISQPYVVAYMSEKLELSPAHRVLEIGTGSGYQTAVLSHLAGEVVSVERYRTLADEARGRLVALGCANVTVVTGDGMEGWAERAPYDRILVTAAATEVPQPLIDQLAEGGMMILPLGPHGGTQHLVRLRKGVGARANDITREKLIAVRFVPLLPGRAQAL